MPKTFKDSDLEEMDFELDNPRDLELSLIEKLRLNLNKHLSGTGCGDGYNCKECGSDDNMHYFKRVYDIKSAKWNSEKTKFIIVPPIGKFFKLPNELFYLTGKCNFCSHEQQVCNRPNKVTYWFDDSSFM